MIEIRNELKKPFSKVIDFIELKTMYLYSSLPDSKYRTEICIEYNNTIRSISDKYGITLPGIINLTPIENEMSRFEKQFKYICSTLKISSEELHNKINKEVNDLHGLIDEESAMFLVFKRLGIIMPPNLR